MKSEYLIIGGSAGGVGAIEAIREFDKVGPITLISEEPYGPYSRPMISDFLAGIATFDKMQYRPTNFWKNSKVKPLLGRRVIGVDFDNKSVVIEKNKKLYFEKLLIATGGKPIIPMIEGMNGKRVHTFTNLSDARIIKERLDEIKKVVVIGGGLIGVSVAEALTKLNKMVTVVELKDKILNLIVDDVTSHVIEVAMKECGVEILTNNSVKKIVSKHHNEEKIEYVVLNDGRKILCDTVIIAIGVIPRIELLNSSGMDIKKGILVDRYMSTNIPDVYACGDVSEGYDFVSEGNRVLALWPLAYQGGRIAGQNMAGSKIEYRGGTIMSALKYFDVPTISVGLVNPDNSKGEYEVLSSLDGKKGIYKKIVLRNNVICGMTLVGEVEKAGIYFNLIKEKIKLTKFKKNLFSPEFGLSYLPKSYSMKLLRS